MSQLHILNKAERDVSGDSVLAVLGIFIEVCCLFRLIFGEIVFN